MLANGTDTLKLTRKDQEVIKWGRNHEINHSVPNYNNVMGNILEFYSMEQNMILQPGEQEENGKNASRGYYRM